MINVKRVILVVSIITILIGISLLLLFGKNMDLLRLGLITPLLFIPLLALEYFIKTRMVRIVLFAIMIFLAYISWSFISLEGFSCIDAGGMCLNKFVPGETGFVLIYLGFLGVASYLL